MVHVICTRLNSAIEVERSRNLYANLRSILMLLEIEQSHDYKAEKNNNLLVPNKIKFDCLIREGAIYLGMVNTFKNWLMPNTTKNVVLRKTLNVLGKVRFQHKRMLRMRNLLLNGTVDNSIREDIIFLIDNMIRENDELRFDTIDEYDIDEYEVISFYDWQSETKARTAYMRIINLMTDKIYSVIIKRYLMLYSILKKYRKRATQFLRNNSKILKSRKLRRRQRQNSCCDYHILKRLIASCHHILSPI